MPPADQEPDVGVIHVAEPRLELRVLRLFGARSLRHGHQELHLRVEFSEVSRS